jgi:hypothetical protein
MKVLLETHKIFQAKLVEILLACGTKACLAKAANLEFVSNPLQSIHLRELGLAASDVVKIADLIHQSKDIGEGIKSFSLSYNNEIGDLGCMTLTSVLPKSIVELGLVDCGITDLGGVKLLEWAKKSSKLRMMCVEQNAFTDEMRKEFKHFSSENLHILLEY